MFVELTLDLSSAPDFDKAFIKILRSLSSRKTSQMTPVFPMFNKMINFTSKLNFHYFSTGLIAFFNTFVQHYHHL